MFIPDPIFFHPRSRILDSNFFHPGSLIPDLNFFHPGSWIPDPGSRILDPGSASQNLGILTKKNGFSALRNMIRVFHPGSGSRILILNFYPSRILILYPRSQIQGSKRHRSPDPGSQIRIRNTGDFGFAHAVGGSVGY